MTFIPGIPVRIVLLRRINTLGEILLTILLFVPAYLLGLWISRMAERTKFTKRPPNWRQDT